MMIVMVLLVIDDDEDYDDEYDDDGDDDGDDVYADHESTKSVIRDGSIGAAQGILSLSTVKVSSSCDCCCVTCMMCCTSSTLTEHAGWCY